MYARTDGVHACQYMRYYDVIYHEETGRMPDHGACNNYDSIEEAMLHMKASLESFENRKQELEGNPRLRRKLTAAYHQATILCEIQRSFGRYRE